MAKVKKVQFVEAESLPVCQFCNEELDTIARSSKGFMTTSTVYSCPYCKAVLAVSDTFNG